MEACFYVGVGDGSSGIEVCFYSGVGDGSFFVLVFLMISLMPHIMSNATIIITVPIPK